MGAAVGYPFPAVCEEYIRPVLVPHGKESRGSISRAISDGVGICDVQWYFNININHETFKVTKYVRDRGGRDSMS